MLLLAVNIDRSVAVGFEFRVVVVGGGSGGGNI